MPQPAVSRWFDQPLTSVLQPDLGKWGGVPGCLEVGRRALQHYKVLWPHWLGGGIGLTAPLNLKAAVGGAGDVEVDANPLRELLATRPFALTDDTVTLDESPGVGVELQATRGYLAAVADA